ncbi:hypothetical protein M5K25_004967 [Dendrobium thyrsiflorum]|uniref:Uncharacterized protein n=1 Tax=Dendrobium thyrsiflorum TaxID=117978 RepID=A0ABD0VHF9_DENTH
MREEGGVGGIPNSSELGGKCSGKPMVDVDGSGPDYGPWVHVNYGRRRRFAANNKGFQRRFILNKNVDPGGISSKASQPVHNSTREAVLEVVNEEPNFATGAVANNGEKPGALVSEVVQVIDDCEDIGGIKEMQTEVIVDGAGGLGAGGSLKGEDGLESSLYSKNRFDALSKDGNEELMANGNREVGSLFRELVNTKAKLSIADGAANDSTSTGAKLKLQKELKFLGPVNSLSRFRRNDVVSKERSGGSSPFVP